MDDHEAQRIAAAAHQLRPDWPVASLLTIIRKNLIDRPRRDVAVALAWVACETNTANPARVLEAGPWWKAAGVEGKSSHRDNPEPADRCTTCSLSQARCRQLWTGDHDFAPDFRPEGPDDWMRRRPEYAGIAAAREYARQAIGDAKVEREPAPAPEPVAANPNVDRLRAVIADDEVSQVGA